MDVIEGNMLDANLEDSALTTFNVYSQVVAVRPVTKLYKRRFIILTILCGALFANGEAWMTFGTVTNTSASYFRVSEQAVNWFGNVFLLAYAVIAFPSTFTPQFIGLKWTLITGCGLNFFGILLRFISFVISNEARFTNFMIAMFGNALIGLAQGFLLNIPSLVSARWFGERERAMSTSLAYMCNAVGVGVGFLDIFIIMGDRKSDKEIHYAFMCVTVAELIFNILIFVPSLIFLKEYPKYAPSLSEIRSKVHLSMKDLRKLAFKMARLMLKVIKDKNSLVALYTFSSYYGIYVSMFIFLNSMIVTLVKDNGNISGYIGSIGVILGGFSTLLTGYIMNLTKNKKNRLIGFFINMICASSLLIVSILISHEKLTNVAAVILFILYLNFCPIYISVGCEILADITYPLDPNISASVSLIFGNIFGVIVTYGIGYIKAPNKYYTALGVSMLVYTINCLIFICIRFQKNRTRADKVKPIAVPAQTSA